MFSARKRSSQRKPGLGTWRKGSLSSKLREGFKPHLSMRVWLTALFVLVTALAAVTAYGIVRPILQETLNRASEAAFRQVGEQFESQIERDPNLTMQRIRSFAATRGLQWGIVRVGDGKQIDGNLEEWHAGVVKSAVSQRTSKMAIEPVETGDFKGQLQATYAAPINVRGEEGTAVVFNKFFTRSDIENVDAALANIERLALLAGALALLIAGFVGYFAAALISRRVSRLGLAAERLAAGNFDERIETRVEDEVGSLGATFNAMAASLQGGFDQIKQEKKRGGAILDGMTDAVVGVGKDVNAVFLNPRPRQVLES